MSSSSRFLITRHSAKRTSTLLMTGSAISPATNSAKGDPHERLNTESTEAGGTENKRRENQMRKTISFAVRVAALFFAAVFIAGTPSTPQESPSHFYLGFDRNIYPDDAAMPILRKTFAFSGYWLSPPPGEKTNTWA